MLVYPIGFATRSSWLQTFRWRTTVEDFAALGRSPIEPNGLLSDEDFPELRKLRER